MESSMIPVGSRLGNKAVKLNILNKTLDDGRVLFENLSFGVPPHAIVDIVGGNDTGKSTLFKIIGPARRDREPGVREPEPRGVPVAQLGLRGNLGRQRVRRGR